MKRTLLTLAFVLIATAAAFAQSAASFPGLTAETRKQLVRAKRSTPIALPAWVPAGFTAKQVYMSLGPRVKIEDKQLVIVYSRKLADGRLQRFSIEAGFDGLGDLMYDGSKKLRTPVGDVYLIYQPKDDDGKKMLDFAMTEWFNVGRTAYHYVGMYGTEEGDATLAMISRSETEKILRSLRRF